MSETRGKATIGFIGLGAMGSRIATRLLHAGYPMLVYDRSRDKAQQLANLGARVSDSAPGLAADAEVVMSSLADDSVVEQVLLGDGCVVDAMRPGTTLIDLSSVYPDASRSVGAAARDRGVAMLDAPVSGSTPQAASGDLVVFVGGERANYERCRPIFDVIGQSSHYMGSSGAGTTMKLVVNALLGAEIQVLAEALALGIRAGLDREALFETLGGTVVLTPGQKSKLENARADSYPVTFALRLMWKDFGNIMRLAQACAVSMPVTSASQQICAVEQSKGIEEDFSAVIRTMEELASLPATTKS